MSKWEEVVFAVVLFGAAAWVAGSSLYTFYRIAVLAVMP